MSDVGRNDVDDDRYWSRREQSAFEREILTRFAALERDVSKLSELPAKVEKNHDTQMAELRTMRTATATPPQDQALLMIHRLLDNRNSVPWADRIMWAIAAGAIGYFVSHLPGLP